MKQYFFIILVELISLIYANADSNNYGLDGPIQRRLRRNGNQSLKIKHDANNSITDTDYGSELEDMTKEHDKRLIWDEFQTSAKSKEEPRFISRIIGPKDQKYMIQKEKLGTGKLQNNLEGRAIGDYFEKHGYVFRG